MNSRLICLVIVVVLFAMTTTVLATNGMDLEGYGPIATGMGGASMAYNNGTAGFMNNPATLSLLPSGWHLDIALGMLGPHVDAVVATPNGTLKAKSKATAFFMPTLGLVRKQCKLVYGLGVFGQGGMGTEYSKTSWMADPSQGADTALTEGLVNRSEVSVGRAMGAFGYDVTDKLSVTVTADFVWAGIDLQMVMSEVQFQNLANPQAQTIGIASGTLFNTFGQMYEPFGGHGISRLYHAYFDFSNDNAFTGEATNYGFAGKIGVIFRATPKLTFGAMYQSQTMLGDLKTNNAKLSMGVNIDPGIFQGQPTGSYQDMIIPVTGKIAILNFQWPATFGAGAAYQATEKLMLAADFKYIMWSQVMKNFKMSFTADNTAENGGFAGLVMDATLFQKWEDQAVIAAGGSYRITNQLTLRAGFNYGKNPVPEKYLNALFPAIVETHGTIGGGYEFNPNNQVNVSITTAFKKEVTNPGNGSTIPAVTSNHSQLNASIMFSHSF
jgi:long-chain fatty acid transport protein